MSGVDIIFDGSRESLKGQFRCRACGSAWAPGGRRMCALWCGGGGKLEYTYTAAEHALCVLHAAGMIPLPYWLDAEVAFGIAGAAANISLNPDLSVRDHNGGIVARVSDPEAAQRAIVGLKAVMPPGKSGIGD